MNVGDVGTIRYAAEVAKQKRKLAKQIGDCLQPSAFDQPTRYFAPLGAVKALISRPAVRAALGYGPRAADIDPALLDYIVSEAGILFAILVHLGLQDRIIEQAMVLFQRHSVHDQSLPFEATGHGSKLTMVDPGETVWSAERRSNFYDRQWIFLAPVFSTEHPICILEKNRILPFNLDPGRSAIDHGRNVPLRVTIPQSHIEGPSNVVRIAQKVVDHDARFLSNQCQ